jgi:ribonuclease HI
MPAMSDPFFCVLIFFFLFFIGPGFQRKRKKMSKTEPSEKKITVFTDGACSRNPGPGGTGTVILLPDGRTIQNSMHIPHTTNNIAELEAIRQGFLICQGCEPAPIQVHTDSQYCIKVLSGAARAHKNQELVKDIQRLSETLGPVSYTWVKAHNGDPLNEHVNSLAQQASKQCKKTAKSA